MFYTIFGCFEGIECVFVMFWRVIDVLKSFLSVFVMFMKIFNRILNVFSSQKCFNYCFKSFYSLLKNMLISMTIFMLHSRYDQKFALVRAVLDLWQTFQRLVFVLGQKNDETQRMIRVGEKSIDVLKRSVDKLLAVWWIGLRGGQVIAA